MANQVTVSNDHSINVTIEPPANVQVQVSRAVIGTVANVASANLANYVIQNSQPNITSVGTLVGLTSNGNITAPFFIGNVVGNISGNFTVPGTNTAVLFNQTGNAGASDALTFNYVSNVLTANGNIVANYYIGDGSQLTGIVTQQSNNANFANVANIANSVAGANVTGIVANANYSAYSGIAGVANSVAVANVVGIGNIAVINLDGNAGNILYGNGVFSTVPNVSNVANANYANFAGEAFSVSASNIVGTVNLANFATTANSVAGANVTGAVANATHANTSDSAITAGTVTTNAQPNITSVGTLTGLVVSGNITPNANITYDLGNNTNRFKDLYLAGNSIILGAQTISANATGISFTGNLSGDASGLANITGANVTGQVGNALIASTVYTNAQPNITSVGNLTSVTVSGDALVAGNLTVGGNISYVNVNNLVVQDPVIELGGGPNGAPLTTNDGKDRGTLLHYYTTQPIDAFMGWDNGNGEFAFGSNVTNNLDVMTFNTLGNVRAQTFLGNLTGLASSATVAASANSVALANVSGAGNIASINLDGNVSNLLTGAGTFVAIPTVSSNANYANFAGQVVDATQSNITSVGTLTSLDVSGNVSANAYQLTVAPGTLTVATGQMAWSASEQTMNLGMNYGVTQQVGLENYILIKASATINDGQVVMFTGANGDNVTGAPANTASAGFRPEYIIGVATQNIANNDFGYVTVFGVVHGLNTNAYNVGDILWVDNATPGGLIATRPSDPNFQIEVAAVTKKSGGDGHIQVRVTAFNNIDSLTDVTITTPSNGQALVYSGNIWVNGNPNIANIANTVSDNAQPNITSVGNLPYLQVSNSANADGVIQQFASNNITFATNFSNTVTYLLTTQYHPNASTGYSADRTIRSRGNVTTPTTAVSGDRIYQKTNHVFNGTTNPLAVSETYTAVGTVNANTTAQWTGGQWNLSTGNPTGDTANQGNSSWSNQLTFTNSGSLQINPGGPANTSIGQAGTPILITNYGLSSTDLVGVGGINQQKARGNRDGLLSVQPNDQIGRNNFWAYNGTQYQSLRPASIYAQVDNSYVANATIIPINMVIRSISSSNTNVDTFFYGNGLTSLPGNLNVAGTSNLGSNSNVIITGGTGGQVLSTDGAGNLSWITGSGGSGSPGGSNTQLQFNNNGAFGGISTVTWNGANISLGAVANVKVTGGSNNEVVRTDGTGNLSFSSIAQTLLVGTRVGPYTVPITNYTFQVTARTGNVTVYVN